MVKEHYYKIGADERGFLKEDHAIYIRTQGRIDKGVYVRHSKGNLIGKHSLHLEEITKKDFQEALIGV